MRIEESNKSKLYEVDTVKTTRTKKKNKINLCKKPKQNKKHLNQVKIQTLTKLTRPKEDCEINCGETNK